MERATEELAQSLLSACQEDRLTWQTFVEWAELNFPLLYTPLASFLHNLLFHGHPFPNARIPYVPPKLDMDSRVLPNSSQNPMLMNLSMTSQQMGGKVC